MAIFFFKMFRLKKETIFPKKKFEFWIFWQFFTFYFLYLWNVCNFFLRDFSIFYSYSFISCLGNFFKVSKVTTKSVQDYYWTQKWAKMGQKKNIINLFFFAWRAKKSLAGGQSPPQKLEVGPCSAVSSSFTPLKKSGSKL